MIGIDLFSGAGGMALGANKAGIKVLFSVELNRQAANTYVINHPKTIMFNMDISNIEKRHFKSREKIDIIFGGPPCQGFSTSNQRTRNFENTSNWLFKEFLRIVKYFLPKWVVFENVKGIFETKNGFFINSFLYSLQAMGYNIITWELNAADYGVPQIRRRIFVIGNLMGFSVEKPRALFSNYVSVKEAINDLPVLSNGADNDEMPYKCEAISDYSKKMRNGGKTCRNNLVTLNSNYIIERYKYIPKGGNWENIPEHLMQNYKDRLKCHTGIYRRLSENAPAVVLGNFRKNMLIHPLQDRGLSVREAARLQSFPDNYVFSGSIGYQQQQVGNAVPPLLAEAVFKQIISINQL